MSNIVQRIQNALLDWQKSCTMPPTTLFLGEEELYELDADEDMIVLRFATMEVVAVAKRRFLGLGV